MGAGCFLFREDVKIVDIVTDKVYYILNKIVG